jgi:hypothetical protein
MGVEDRECKVAILRIVRPNLGLVTGDILLLMFMHCGFFGCRHCGRDGVLWWICRNSGITYKVKLFACLAVELDLNLEEHCTFII